MTASNMSAGLAHLPDMEGQYADACGSYTQSDRQGDESRVERPPQQWLAEWHEKYQPPVVRRIKAVHCHPKSGHHWEQPCKNARLKCGFFPVLAWECLYKHDTTGLFLTVYVVVFRRVGRKCRLAPVLAGLHKHLGLDQPTYLDGAVYRVVTQHRAPPDLGMANAEPARYETLFTHNDNTEQRSDPPPSGLTVFFWGGTTLNHIADGYGATWES